MDGSIGKQYLKDYLAKSDPLFEEYLQKKIGEARKINKIPAELLKRFLETIKPVKVVREPKFEGKVLVAHVIKIKEEA